MYFGIGNSFTMGYALACLLIIANVLFYQGNSKSVYNKKNINGNIILLYSVCIVGGGVLAHILVTSIMWQINMARSLASLGPLMLGLVASKCICEKFSTIPTDKFQLGLHRIFILMCTMAIFGMFNISLMNIKEWRSSVGIFPEPSNFAIAFIPLLLYMSTTTKNKTNLLCMLSAYTFAFGLQNLTLLVGCILASILCLRIRTAMILIALGLLALFTIDLSYYLDRIDMSGESQNLSNLVYLQGWQLIEESFTRSSNIGIGFQQLGMTATDVPAAAIIRSLREGNDLNELDGGFVFSKLASEFGIFGASLALAYLYLANKSALALRRAALNKIKIPTQLILAHSLIISYGFELFLRGGGYFTSGSLLFLTSLWILRESWRSKMTLPTQGSSIGTSNQILK